MAFVTHSRHQKKTFIVVFARTQSNNGILLGEFCVPVRKLQGNKTTVS